MIKDDLKLTEEEYKEMDKLEDDSIRVNLKNAQKVIYNK